VFERLLEVVKVCRGKDFDLVKIDAILVDFHQNIPAISAIPANA